MSTKIQKNKLGKYSFNNNEIFGDWIYDLDNLSNKFNNAEPYEHIVIDNFFQEDIIDKIEQDFPKDFTNWYKYENPLEHKLAYDNISNLSSNIQDVFYILSKNQVVEIFRKITNIKNLDYDKYLHGAGIHVHPRNGKLAIHLDYEKHPISGKERRLNLILYLNKEWKDEWNGATELWNHDVSKCITKSPIKFNSCLIFRTNDISWHGLPEPIKCPEGMFRKSLAYYYISPLESRWSLEKIGGQEDGYRKKATYSLRPEDEKNEYILNLIKIRSERRLKRNDLI